MPLVDMTTLHRSQLAVLQQGNGRCAALDDVLTTSLTEMFCNQIVIHDDNSMTINDNSQEAISKLQIIMKSNNFLSKGLHILVNELGSDNFLSELVFHI